VVKPKKHFFALVHAESSLCGGPRVQSDVSGLAPPDHVYALLTEIWRSCKFHLCRSRRISCCSLGNPSNKRDTDAAEDIGGGHPSPQRRRTHASTDGGRPRELATNAVDRGPPPSGFASPTRSPDRGARLSRAASKPKRQNTRCYRSDPSHRSAMNWPSPRHARLASEPAGLLPALLSALARR
jgi:hypothetical protein